MLKDVRPGAVIMPEVNRLLDFLAYFRAGVAWDEIPPNSILREFIGGSCFAAEG